MKKILTFLFVSFFAVVNLPCFADAQYLRFWLPDPHQLQPSFNPWGWDTRTNSLTLCGGGIVSIWAPTMSSSTAFVPPGITYGSTLTWANRTYTGPYPNCLATPGAIVNATGTYNPANGMVQFNAGGTPFNFQLISMPGFTFKGNAYTPVRCKNTADYPNQIGCCFSTNGVCEAF